MRPAARRVFAIGNAVIASLFCGLGLVLPIRHWAVYGPLVVLILVVGSSAVLTLAKTRWADQSLRVAAFTLLIFGLFVATAAGLTLAFLSGVHGQFLQHGIPLMLLTVGILVPYVFVYPAVLLAFSSSKDGANAA